MKDLPMRKSRVGDGNRHSAQPGLSYRTVVTAGLLFIGEDAHGSGTILLKTIH